MRQDEPIIALRGISRSFKSGLGERVDILKNLNLEIRPGSFNVIRGESGSGKTTLLRILGMLDTEFDGEYQFAGQPIQSRPDWFLDELRAENIGFIFQEGRLFGHLSLEKNIEIPLVLQGDRRTRENAQKIVESLAPRFFSDDKRTDILHLKPGPASGGQKQRASIMRAIINRPSIILADEPTASLHGDLKQYVVAHLKQLCTDGHTVIVVSHDSVFYGVGRQLELVDGELKELDDPPLTAEKTLPTKRPRSLLFGGWRPRAPLGILARQAARETFSRPIFLSLILISLIVGVCQVSVFASVIIGAQQFVDDAMTKGSRLNRVEIKPRRADRGEDDRFPVRDQIAAWETIDAVVPRRVTLASLVNTRGEANTFSAMGLHPNDPEYGLLEFVAGTPFSGEHDQLEIIITVGLLSELFDTTALEEGSADYADFIGRSVTVVLRQYTTTGEVKGETEIKLRVQGIILYAEGGRQLYLPNTTHLAFDRFKRDRLDEFPLPLNETADAWTDLAFVAQMADFPWEDSLHIYAAGMRDVIPVIKSASKLGYKPKSDIWRFKWALDVQDTAWRIFVPLLALIVVAVAITVAANIFTSAKLRETELALWRVLGMRRGDLVLTQVLATVFAVTTGTILGLGLGAVLVEQSKALLAERSAEAAIQGGTDTQSFDAIFAPVSEFYGLILLVALVLGVIAALYPAFRTANTDPAKVLQS
jgi:ABC-type lipoprotein export system ATPase subunit/ABC-type lipoprotein release transport system permease subunit